MGACTFKEEVLGVKGTTAYAEKQNACGIDTAIYLPPKHSFNKDTVNVVLWMHGFYVQSAKDLLHPSDASADMNLRQSLIASGKDVILIAPWLGYRWAAGAGTYSLGTLGSGTGCETYLNEVLKGIVELQKSLSSTATSTLKIGKLIVAGHSGGGSMMRDVMDHLGGYKDRLKECWGFDCFYDTQWPDWARQNPSQEKYFYFGNGSGDGGLHAFNMMREVYGTPKKPRPAHGPIANLYVAPAVDKVFTARDDTAFQSIADIKDWGPPGPNAYNDVREKTDPYLDQSVSKYWNAILPSLTEHFQVVRNLLRPRIEQSQWL